MNYTWIGFLAIAILNGSALPQIWKIWKRKKVEDMSIWREIMLMVGCTLYITYGVFRKDPVIITSNLWGAMMYIIIIGLQAKFKK